MLYQLTRPALAALLALTAVALGGVLLPGCGTKEETAVSAKYEVADDQTEESPRANASSSPQASQPATPKKPPTVPASQPTDYAVPKGGTDELVQFIQDLEGRTPAGTTQSEMIADMRKMQRARIEAAEKILATDDLVTETRQTAVSAKLDSLRILAEIGESVEQEIRQFSQELREDQDPELARLGRIIQFGILLGDTVEQEPSDFQAVMQELKAILEQEGPREEVFAIARQAARVMQSRGQNELAVEAYKLIGDTFKNSDNPQLVDLAQAMVDQAQLLAVDFDSKLEAVLLEEPEATPALIAATKELLNTDNPGVNLLQSTSQAAQTLEYSRHYEAAKELFALIEQAYTGHSDQQLSQQAEQVVDYGKRRVGLLGKPLTIKGRTLDGSEFDWQKYKGKVVLVDFWATWCGPCIDEIPNIKANYEKYHDQGFEVVGINLDDSDERVERFLAMQNLPWETVRSADPMADGMDNPLAVEAGVDAIPFVLLVNREGNVESLHVRGEVLDQELERLLGPPSESASQEQTGSLPGGQQAAGNIASVPATNKAR